MRKEIYKELTDLLLDRYKIVNGVRTLLTEDETETHRNCPSVIQHVDLWNNNIEFLDQEDVWDRPAVFVEFGKISWEHECGRDMLRGRGTVILHVVTDWDGSSSASSVMRDKSLEVFDMLSDLEKLLDDFCGSCFSHLTLLESQTNHNHDALLENIEVFGYKGWKNMGV